MDQESSNENLLKESGSTRNKFPVLALTDIPTSSVVKKGAPLSSKAAVKRSKYVQGDKGCYFCR
jgi:hypothetical protein